VTLKLDSIIQGDCIKTMQSFSAGCVDLVFADPPFNIGYKYDEYDDRRSCDEYLDWSKRWIGEVKRVLKDDGTFWLAIGDEYAAELKVMATRDLGLTCRNWVVWYYTFGVHCTHKFTRSHAHLFYFVKNPKRFTFNSDEIRVPSARQLVYADKRANPKGRVPDDTWIVPPAGLKVENPKVEKSKSQKVEMAVDQSPEREREGSDMLPQGGRMAPQEAVVPKTRGRKSKRNGTVPDVVGQLHLFDGWVLRPQDVPGGFSQDSDTWYYSRVCGTFNERQGFHGCQMPEQVLGRIIRASSHEGDVVLDPFVGSGTTAAVAKKLGRKFVGIELSADYAKQTRARLRKIKPGEPLTGPVDPLASVPKTANGRVRVSTA